MKNQEFIKSFEKKVKSTIKKYNLLSKHDKVIVACSGGKDSTTVLYLLNKLGYKVEGLIIDLLIGDWSKRNLENIKQFCKNKKIKLHVINMRKELGSSICFIRSGIQSKTNLKNCMICGIIKRWLLNKKSRELGATKLAMGHNLDDEAETILMNLFKGDLKLSLGLGPKPGIITDKKFVQRIKPLYFCLNKKIKKYSKIMRFPVLYQPCPCSANVFRRKIRENLAKIEKENPAIENQRFSSIENQRFSSIKINIVNNFLRMLPNLRKKYKNKEELRHCNICGEPSRKAVCKMCELIKILKD